MPEIPVTETQREELAAIEADLEAAYVDTYGHIRTTDAIQYLLDTYTPPGERADEVAHERIATAGFTLLQEVATDVEGVPGSGIDTETMRGELLSALGVEEFAARLADLDAPETADAEADPEDGAVDGANEPVDDDGPAVDGAPTAADTPSEGGDTSDENGERDNADAGAPAETDGPDSILSAANQLLDAHDEKWRKSGGEEPYEVDLPDGTTEAVRTKDDVRGLLFKHY